MGNQTSLYSAILFVNKKAKTCDACEANIEDIHKYLQENNKKIYRHMQKTIEYEELWNEFDMILKKNGIVTDDKLKQKIKIARQDLNNGNEEMIHTFAKDLKYLSIAAIIIRCIQKNCKMAYKDFVGSMQQMYEQFMTMKILNELETKNLLHKPKNKSKNNKDLTKKITIHMEFFDKIEKISGKKLIKRISKKEAKKMYDAMKNYH